MLIPSWFCWKALQPVPHYSFAEWTCVVGLLNKLLCISIQCFMFSFYRRKEGNVLFNDALNTFYLWLYGVRHMVKDHSDSKKGNPLPPHGLLFPISSKGSFLYASSHRQDNTYHGLCYTSRGALAGTRNSSMGPPHGGSIWWPIALWANTLTTELHLAPLFYRDKIIVDMLSVERNYILVKTYLVGGPFERVVPPKSLPEVNNVWCFNVFNFT